MTLTCNCDHPRTEHLGGSKYRLNDNSVLHCMHEKCTCKTYKADKKSQTLKQHVMLASITSSFIIAILCAVALVLGHFAIDATFDGITMTDKYTYKKFENGKEINMTSSITGKPYIGSTELVKENLFMIFFMMVVTGGLVGGMFWPLMAYENNWRKIVRDEE